MAENIIVAIIGLISGGIGSLIAPWAKYGVEKYNLRLLNRKDFLQNFRKEIEKEDFDIEEFINSSYYSQIRDEIPQEMRSEIESYVLTLSIKTRGTRQTHYKATLLDVVSKLEKKWGLL